MPASDLPEEIEQQPETEPEKHRRRRRLPAGQIRKQRYEEISLRDRASLAFITKGKNSQNVFMASLLPDIFKSVYFSSSLSAENRLLFSPGEGLPLRIILQQCHNFSILSFPTKLCSKRTSLFAKGSLKRANIVRAKYFCFCIV